VPAVRLLPQWPRLTVGAEGENELVAESTQNLAGFHLITTW
jgi:hypothetical protein